MSGGDLFDIYAERATERASARVLNRAGACVAWYDEEEFADAGDLIRDDDKVELYNDRGEWRETITGAEFKELI